MRPETFYIRTFGCQMNVHDSDRMAQLLMGAGMCPVDDPRQAGLIVINTCSVRAKPEHKALSEAGRHQQARRVRGVQIVLAGCVARQEGQRLLEAAPYLDAVIGPGAIGQLVEIVDQISVGQGPILAVEDHSPSDPRFVPLGRQAFEAVSRHVTIMKGCDNFCSFCVVPLVRGREVSRVAAEVLAEVEELGKRGVREVCLLGQNVNSYRDPDGSGGFAALLGALERQAAVERIRFTTSHPKDLGDDLIEAMAGSSRVVEHLHLAMQSGSDAVLERMRRGHTRKQFLERVARLRRSVAGIAITTDLIVGFPGETEPDFAATLEAVEQAAFDGAFSFKYSPRPGTLAAQRYPDDVTPAIKQSRLERLHARLEALETASLTRLLGRRVQILVEGASQRDGHAMSGRTRCSRVCNFEADRAVSPGDLVDVRILQVRGHTLWGQAVPAGRSGQED